MAFPITTQARLDHVAPFFIVHDVIPSIAFYRDRLGFEVTFLGPDDGPIGHPHPAGPVVTNDPQLATLLGRSQQAEHFGQREPIERAL